MATEMPEEDKKPEAEVTEIDGGKKKPARSPLLKYAMFGGGGLVLALVIAFAVAFFLKGGDADRADDSVEVAVESDTTPTADRSSHEGSHARTDHEPLDSQESEPALDQEPFLEEIDQSAIEKIMDNLAFLDYEPDIGEVEEDSPGLSVEDSVEAVSWLEKEKTALAEKEKELNARQKKLEKLDKEVNQKLLKLEQAESARVSKLAKLYDGMDPRSVTKLMANLDDATVVAILPRMKIKNASAVLSLMPSQRAARLSKRMITIAEN